MIPNRIIRTVPEHPSGQAEHFWEKAKRLHPGWDHLDLRDPLDPVAFPLTADHWLSCMSGAQLAGLVRLEALWTWGGFYLDSDLEVFRPLEPLRAHHAVAAWEDDHVVPDAFLGAEAQHPAIGECIALAIERLARQNRHNLDWRTGPGTWSTGPGVTTEILIGRPDVRLLDRELVYPVHYTEKHKCAAFEPTRATYAMHWWNASWLAPA